MLLLFQFFLRGLFERNAVLAEVEAAFFGRDPVSATVGVEDILALLVDLLKVVDVELVVDLFNDFLTLAALARLAFNLY